MGALGTLAIPLSAINRWLYHSIIKYVVLLPTQIVCALPL